MPAVRIRTDRLWLRPFDAEDVDRLQVVFNLPDVRRYLLDDSIVPRSWVMEEVESSQASFAAHGWGLFTIAADENGPAMGFTGYREFHEPPEVELIYGLDPALWGRGFAHEAATAAARFGFDSLGFDPILVSLDAPNEASMKLALRLGCREVRRSAGELHEQVHLELSEAAFVPKGERYEIEPVEDRPDVEGSTSD